MILDEGRKHCVNVLPVLARRLLSPATLSSFDVSDGGDEGVILLTCNAAGESDRDERMLPIRLLFANESAFGQTCRQLGVRPCIMHLPATSGSATADQCKCNRVILSNCISREHTRDVHQLRESADSHSTSQLAAAPKRN